MLRQGKHKTNEETKGNLENILDYLTEMLKVIWNSYNKMI